MPANATKSVSVMVAISGFVSFAPKQAMPTIVVTQSNKPNATNTRQKINHFLNDYAPGFKLPDNSNAERCFTNFNVEL